MNYSKYIDRAAEIVSKKLECDLDEAIAYIENVVFNTDVDLCGFFNNILH